MTARSRQCSGSPSSSATGWWPGLVLALALPGAAVAADYERERAELEALEADLEAVQEDLEADRAARDELEQELARLERQVSEASRRLHELRSQREEAQARVAELREAYRAERERLAEHREMLAEQVVAAYATGGRERLRLLLEQDDPARAQRLLAYHEDLNRARGERMRAVMAELEGLAEMRGELREELAELEALAAEVRAEREALEERRAERDERRRELAERIERRQDREQALRDEVAEQEALLEDLRERLADVPDGAAGIEDLAEARGELPWPVEGELTESFGDARDGGLRRTGIVVDAEPGEPVRAVAPGQVVFSDWLRGLGLLVIIDHGNEFLTLYGRSEALYVEVGEWVDAGDRVATVGDVGDRAAGGLYFEIRQGDEPRNPTAWLR